MHVSHIYFAMVATLYSRIFESLPLSAVSCETEVSYPRFIQSCVCTSGLIKYVMLCACTRSCVVFRNHIIKYNNFGEMTIKECNLPFDYSFLIRNFLTVRYDIIMCCLDVFFNDV